MTPPIEPGDEKVLAEAIETAHAILELGDWLIPNEGLVADARELASALLAEHAARVEAEKALQEARQRVQALQAPLVATLPDERQAFRDLQTAHDRLVGTVKSAINCLNTNPRNVSDRDIANMLTGRLPKEPTP